MQIIGKVLVEDWQSDPSFILDIQYSIFNAHTGTDANQ